MQWIPALVAILKILELEPRTYSLPNDYALFVEAGSVYWWWHESGRFPPQKKGPRRNHGLVGDLLICGTILGG